MKLAKANINRNQLIYTFLVVVIVVFVALASVAVFRNTSDKKTAEKEVAEQQAMSESIANIAKSGQKLSEIPAEDTAARQEFMQEGAAYYNLSPNEEISSQYLTNICIHNATAEITQNVRAVEAYRNDYEQVKRDVRKVNEACYEKYSDTPYVPPADPKSHPIDPETFLPRNQHQN